MSRKSVLLALAAAATFGLSTLAAEPANAKPGFRGSPGHLAGVRVNPRMLKPIHRPGRRIIIVRPRWKHPHWHWRHRHVWYAPRPVVYRSVAPVVSTGRCTCLTKEYTQEGAVLFKDICTNEAAINPPPAPAPQQTGMVQPQPEAPQPR